MNQRIALSFIATITTSHAWNYTPGFHIRTSSVSPSSLFSSPDPKSPCWQDNYDSEDDCLSTTYSAAFVAEEWIKSMPCGKDADCLPENLSHPGVMGDAGVERVDIMEYLNIKRAVPVGKNSGNEEMSP